MKQAMYAVVKGDAVKNEKLYWTRNKTDGEILGVFKDLDKAMTCMELEIVVLLCRREDMQILAEGKTWTLIGPDHDDPFERVEPKWMYEIRPYDDVAGIM